MQLFSTYVTVLGRESLSVSQRTEMWEATFTAKLSFTETQGEHTSYNELYNCGKSMSRIWVRKEKWVNLCMNAAGMSQKCFIEKKSRLQNCLVQTDEIIRVKVIDTCGKPGLQHRLTWCLWRSTSVLLSCRREQHRSCLWADRCPGQSGSSGSPCPCWTHWKPSTCHLETGETGNGQRVIVFARAAASLVFYLISDGTYPWRRQISHRPSRRRRWCLKVDLSRSDWWPSGNPSAPCCYAPARTTCPAKID